MKITKEIFPQFIEDADPKASGPVSINSYDKNLEHFYSSDMIGFIKASSVSSFKKTRTGLKYVISADKYINRKVMTHETVMNQLVKQKNEKPVDMHVRIDVWTQDTLRIRYGLSVVKEEEIKLPPEQRMLIKDKPDKIRFSVAEDDKNIFLKTKKILITIEKSTAILTVLDSKGEFITKQARYCIMPADSTGMAIGNDGRTTSSFDSFEIASKEQIYGLGERFDHVARKGAVTDFWNKDAIGTSSRRTYVNVPFIVSTAKYGIFLNSSAKTQWDIATKEASTLSFGTAEPVMDYFIITGKSMSEVIFNYCSLTGFSPVPPIWSFGLWMSRNSYMNWDIVFDVANNIRKNNIPCDVLHLDTAWFKDDWNCDLRFSKERFPDPKENISKLNNMGFKISAWQYNFIPPREDNVNYVEAKEKGYLALDKDNNIFRHTNDLPGSWKNDAIIDFSNPEACRWYADQIKDVIRTGISAIKTDFGEGIPEEAKYMNISGSRFHNLYSLAYNCVIFNACKEVSGDNIVWARSGTAGSQRYPLHWGGDSQCTFEGLQGTLRGALSIGLSGLIFYSHDIGGFIGRPTPELYIRWAQMGLFSSHSRCHGGGNTNSREPWSFGEEANRIFKKFADLRYSLLPYIVTEANYCAKNAVPMMKAMVLEAEDDINTYSIEDQYMFGRSILVAPVLESMEKTKKRKVYLPKGIWFDYWTKRRIKSQGSWIEVAVDIYTIPIFIKNGSILAYKKDNAINTEESIFPIEKIESYGKDAEYTITDGKTEYKIQVKDGKISCKDDKYIERLSWK
ncbi:MAG TPA: glycoside hydrolase family 31 protein [Clostridia bacterium]|nr:glycoside hydrolase family 31 protein [Clostridia bacterium]